MNLSPPFRPLEPLTSWAQADDVFWSHRVEQSVLLGQYCTDIKHLIVWLELHGLHAEDLGAALSELKERWSDFEEACEGTLSIPDEEPHCREALENLIEAAEGACGALEDLADEVPESVWEGYDDV